MNEQETRALYDRFFDLLKSNPNDMEMDMVFNSFTDEELDAINFLLEHTHRRLKGIYLRQNERRVLYGTGKGAPVGILSGKLLKRFEK